MVGQETKRFSASGVESALADAKSQGWNAHLSLAHPTAAAMGSGGCAVMVRSGSGIIPASAQTVREPFRYRIAVAWVDAVCRGGIHCISVYLRHSEGLSPANMAILEELYAVVKQVKGPWLIAGDWNLTPQVLSGSAWLKMVSGVIFATELPTCHSSTYDFFVVHESLAPAVAGVQRIEDGGLNPHFLSRLLIRGDSRRFAVRKLVKAPKVQGVLPFGPSPTEPAYDNVCAAALAGELEIAMRTFYITARMEWSGIAGEKLAFVPHRFRWEPPIRHTAKPWTGSSSLSVMWRSLARRAEEISKVLSRTDSAPGMIEAAARHITAAAEAHKSLGRTLQEEVCQQVTSWAASLQLAWLSPSASWAQSLSFIADVKARKLEAATASLKASRWRAAVGSPNPFTAAAATPTKVAYRWIKGNAGWTQNPAGPIVKNDDVPDEDDLPIAQQQEGSQCLVPSQSQLDQNLEVPLSDQAAVDKQADEWGTLWQELKEYEAPAFNIDEAPLQALLPDAICPAAASFPIGTGLGADNISPRAFMRLSRSAIIAFATLLMAFEKKGGWCQILNLILIVLLPKATGGFRPIGLFPTVIRLWMRARYGLARAWQATHSLPVTFGGAGKSAQYAAWQAAFTAECAALMHLDHIQALLDLVKAFETVPHWILARCAAAKGYPAALLRLSLASYRLQRSIGIAGIQSRLIRATRGITAGAGFATVELEILLFETIEELNSRWASVLTIKEYIDDITLATCGLPQTVIRIMIEALDFLVYKLEVDLLMDVSGSKSKVLAGRPSLAVAVVEAVHTEKLSFTRRGKLLGTDTVGGRRRSTITFLERVQTFSQQIPRLHALRKAGVNSAQMVRMGGPPATLYGCEVMGVSDTSLNLVRARTATAAAPQAGGKNPELTLYTLDGTAGTLDPAFEAHAAPLLCWALAHWCCWFSPQQLALAFQEASLKLTRCKGSWWSAVAGPTTALVATVQRLGWTMPSAAEVIDDLGISWRFGIDSPGAIATACRDSVRRWRVTRIGALLPGLIPESCDIGAPVCPGGTVLVDFASVSGPLTKGTGAAARKTDTWDPAWRHSLVSAASGGQWPQARKAAVAKWNISDANCQLCMAQIGTLEHRFECAATMPEAGWPTVPPAAALAMGRLSAARKAYLRTRGLLVLRLPAPPVEADGRFTWLVEPPPFAETELCWHFDGSMLNGKWKPYRTTGFGVVVTTADGDLVGYGHGVPPHWCGTAAAAEAWALYSVIAQSPFLPAMRTDCLTLIATAALGVQKATEPRRQLARVWQLIATALEGQLEQLADHRMLVWLPAHMSHRSVGEAKRSDGHRLSHIDWRANRLADALAKLAAAANQPSKAVLSLLFSAAAAVKHSAMLLGRTTHAANHHPVHELNGDGETVIRLKRDSVDAPRPVPADRKAPKAAPQPQPAPTPRDVRPWQAPLPSTRRPARRSSPARAAALLEAAQLQRRVEDLGSSLQPSATRRPAAERMEALKQRLMARW
jgi:hypothetical protein